jgi:hypothetical protein
MLTLIFPFQVVNLQDIDAFARSNSLMLSILRQQQENAATHNFMVTTYHQSPLCSNLGQGKIDRFKIDRLRYC